MAPGRAGDEQQHVGDRHVDHPRAEVGLGDHEDRRYERGDHHADRGVALAQVPGAVHHQRRERDDQEHLPELGGLEGEQREVDRALRAACAVAEAEHRQDAHDQRDIDAGFVALQHAVVDAAEHQPSRRCRPRGRSPGGRRSSAGCPARGSAWRPTSVDERAGREAERRERQQRVEREPQRARRGGGRGLLRSLDRALDRRQRHQKVFELPATNFSLTPNQREAISRAIGAAVSAPKPPSSTVTAITIGRLGSPM